MAGSLAGVTVTESTTAGLAAGEENVKAPHRRRPAVAGFQVEGHRPLYRCGVGTDGDLGREVPLEQALVLCAKTTGNDWVDRSWSWHLMAFSTVPATVTTPPLAESLAGVAPAERTTGTGGGAGLAHALYAPSNPNRTSAAAKRGRTESLDQVIPFFTPARRPSSI